jgi:hypothetical protein
MPVCEAKNGGERGWRREIAMIFRDAPRRASVSAFVMARAEPLAENVVRHAECPVLTVRDRERETLPL